MAGPYVRFPSMNNSSFMDVLEGGGQRGELSQAFLEEMPTYLVCNIFLKIISNKNKAPNSNFKISHAYPYQLPQIPKR